jgi:hypothetical protein
MVKKLDFSQSEEDMAVVKRMVPVQREAIASGAISPLVITPQEAINLVNSSYMMTLRQAEVSAIVALLETMALFPPEFWMLVRSCALKLGRDRMLQLMARVFSRESSKMGMLHAADLLGLIADGEVV